MPVDMITILQCFLEPQKFLNAHKAEIKGNVRLLFQTAEELSKGAEIMIKDGAMDGVDAVFGQHIGSLINKEIPAGKVIINPGCCMASFDRFVIKVNGTGCHGSTPEKGIDPVNIASHIVIALQESSPVKYLQQKLPLQRLE